MAAMMKDTKKASNTPSLSYVAVLEIGPSTWISKTSTLASMTTWKLTTPMAIVAMSEI